MTTAEVKTTISFQSVCFSYGDGAVLSNLSFEVPHHSFFCVIGTSGSGKTTLIRLLMGLVKPHAGAISVAGYEPDIARKSGLFAYDPQLPSLLPWLTVEQNICLPLRVRSRVISEKRVKDVMEQVGLLSAAHKRPGELSGGMLARAALVRAWVDDAAQYIILDEPFASLDELRREGLALLLRHLWMITPKTIVYITHDISEAIQLGSHILPLKRGLLGHTVRLFDVTDDARKDEQGKSRSGLHNKLRLLLQPYLHTGRGADIIGNEVVVEGDETIQEKIRGFLDISSDFDPRLDTDAAGILNESPRQRELVKKAFVEMWKVAPPSVKSRLAFRICDFFPMDGSSLVQCVFDWIEGSGKTEYIAAVTLYMGNNSLVQHVKERFPQSGPAARKLHILSLLACAPSECEAALAFVKDVSTSPDMKPEYKSAIGLVKENIEAQRRHLRNAKENRR